MQSGKLKKKLSDKSLEKIYLHIHFYASKAKRNTFLRQITIFYISFFLHCKSNVKNVASIYITFWFQYVEKYEF